MLTGPELVERVNSILDDLTDEDHIALLEYAEIVPANERSLRILQLKVVLLNGGIA